MLLAAVGGQCPLVEVVGVADGAAGVGVGVQPVVVIQTAASEHLETELQNFLVQD